MFFIWLGNPVIQSCKDTSPLAFTVCNTACLPHEPSIKRCPSLDSVCDKWSLGRKWFVRGSLREWLENNNLCSHRCQFYRCAREPLATSCARTPGKTQPQLFWRRVRRNEDDSGSYFLCTKTVALHQIFGMYVYIQSMCRKGEKYCR